MAPLSLLKRAEYGTTARSTIAITLDQNLLLGPLEIGIVVSTILLGVFIMQSGSYWRHRKSDPTRLQVLVLLLLILEFGHTFACMGTIYYFTVTTAGNLIKPGCWYSFSVALVFEAFIISLVQAFYVHRCYIFSRNLILSLIGYTLVLLHILGSLWIAYESWLAVTDPYPFRVQTEFAWLISTVLGMKALVDVYAAGSLCWYLKRSLNGMGSESTTKLVKRILIWTIETGLLTSVTSIAVVICFQLMKFNYVWTAIYLSLTKLYSISLVSSLNQRRAYRMKYDAVQAVTTIPKSPMRFQSKYSTASTLNSRGSSRPASVSQGQTQRRWTDAARLIPLKLTGSVIRRSTITV
ncbi:hypothetical protein E1B28_005140 [Marasmius oreades]|uniref:DUF6534 domain-containing protein n=1 Tax=Marasmius oreades TaxID=181124 RepID=A0A9P7V052_9AGAR|nr:uncharacterized protein E1B28_005140 [Marasmius oreades]KAG7097822.1 hypothetical protein E1B28_005140 [Marasmius oreades]